MILRTKQGWLGDWKTRVGGVVAKNTHPLICQYTSGIIRGDTVGVGGRGKKAPHDGVERESLAGVKPSSHKAHLGRARWEVSWRAESLGENKETRMERIVTRAAPYLYALLRIIGALLYVCHGAQKLFGLFGGVRGGTVPLLSLIGLAGLIELGAQGCSWRVGS
jgi:hypothetical protein